MSVEDAKLYSELMQSKYADQVQPILDRNDGDIDESFLGFTGTYRLLAQLIPKNRVVYDFGCANAFQAYYFRQHVAYVGINPGTEDFFRVDNARFYHMDIEGFVKEYGEAVKKTNAFGICNYVPAFGPHGASLITSIIRDVFIFYPKTADDPDRVVETERLLFRQVPKTPAVHAIPPGWTTRGFDRWPCEMIAFSHDKGSDNLKDVTCWECRKKVAK